MSNSISVEELRNARGGSSSVFMKFIEYKKSFHNCYFCFYEGEDSKYYNSRIKAILGENIVSFPAGNKKEVLKVFKMIKSKSEYNEIRTMFFVDKDFDIPKAPKHEDLFVTPCYSLENFYARESVFKDILKAEFNLNALDDDYNKCIKDFEDRYSEFNKLIIKFNVLVKFQLENKPSIKCNINNIKTKKIINVSIDKVEKEHFYDEYIEDLMTKLELNECDCECLENKFKKIANYELYMRGKNQLDFFTGILNDLNKKNKSKDKDNNYFNEKHNYVNLDINEKNRITILSQYAYTPKELKDFLEVHK